MAKKKKEKTEKEKFAQDLMQTMYDRELEHNNKQFMEALKAARPDIWVIADNLDNMGMDPYILIKIIRQIHNIAIGSGYGQVVVAMEKGVVRYVRGEDVDKIELPVFKRQAKLDTR